MLTCSVKQVELERNIMELNEEESYFPVYKKFLINKVETDIVVSFPYCIQQCAFLIARYKVEDIVYSSVLSLLYTVVCFPYCI